MALADRDQIARPTSRDTSAYGKELMTGILLAALVAALGLRHLLPTEALAPAVVTSLFACAALTAGLALLCRNRFRVICFEVAGALTFIGVVLSVLIEPDQLIGLTGASNQLK